MDTPPVIGDPLLDALKKSMRIGPRKKYKSFEEAKQDLKKQQQKNLQALQETLEEREEKHRELERLYKEEREKRKHAYRFTPVEILEIKYRLEHHLEKMVVFLVGYKWTQSEAGYYCLWELPIKVGHRGIFNTDKPHWSVPFQDLIQFWMDCRRNGRDEYEWNFHTACVEIKQWLKMADAGKFDAKPQPAGFDLQKSIQERRQKELRRSLADLFQAGKLENITLQRKFGDGRMKTKRISVLALRKALQQADPETWGNIQAVEFWNFIAAWISDENGCWIKFDLQFKKCRNTQQAFIVLMLDGYETVEEVEERERQEWFAAADIRYAQAKKEAEEEAEENRRLKAEALVRKQAEQEKKDAEYIAARNAMTPEEKEEDDKQGWLKMMKNSPTVFADFLSRDPSLSRYIPAECTFPFEILARHL